ncbi:MAG: hypothetical protein GQ570_10385 [Helicobacteraceae bacterium]|nr:hypothetical protein [Helicobacteraceae bacterium]
MEITQIINALGSFPNYTEYQSSGKVAYANAVQSWLSQLIELQTQLNGLRTQANALSTDLNAKSELVVEKEALMSPHYDAIEAVNSNANNVNLVALGMDNINTVAVDIVKITTAANDLNEAVSEIDVVATNIDTINSIGLNIANIISVSENQTNINVVAAAISSILVVAADITNINTIAEQINSMLNDYYTKAQTDAKIDEKIAQKQIAQPAFSMSQIIDENTFEVVAVISGRDSNLIYKFETNIGTLTYDGGDSATIDIKDIADDLDFVGYVKCWASKLGYLASEPFELEVTVTFVDEVFALTLQNSDFVANEAQSRDFNIATSSLTSTQKGAQYIENNSNIANMVAQKNTTLSFIPKEITIDASSTKNSLVTYDKIKTAQAVRFIKSDNSVNDVELGSVSEDGVDLISLSNPFNDDSLAYKLELDGNLDDTTNTYLASIVGSLSYETGKFGSALKFTTSSNYVTTNYNLPSFGSYSISLFIKADTINSINQRPLSINGSGDTLLKINNDGAVKPGALYFSVAGTTAESNEIIPADGNYHHVVIVKNDSDESVKIYLDNVECTYNINIFSSDGATQGNIWLGRYYNSSTNNRPPLGLEQIEFYHKAISVDEIALLNIQNNIQYTAVITQDETPVKTFFDDKIYLSLAVASALNKNIITLDTVLTIEATSTSTLLEVTEEIKTNEVLILNGVKDNIGTVSGTAPYSVDITNFGLNSSVKLALKQGVKSLSISGTPTTTTATVTTDTADLISSGDSLLLDVTKVLITNVVETDLGNGIYQYDLTYSITTAPTTISIASKNIAYTEATNIYNPDTERFDVIFDDKSEAGEWMHRSVVCETEGTTLYAPLNTDIYT